MSLGKKERRITIAIGLIIGVTASSMLVRHALDIKSEKTAQRPGNYTSLQTAVGNVPFLPLPKSVSTAIPSGIVVHYEENRSSLSGSHLNKVNSWVIETTGSFRSERLFILVEQELESSSNIQLFRAAEFYIKLKNDNMSDSFENLLDEDLFHIIGRNHSTDELIVQSQKFLENYRTPEGGLNSMKSKNFTKQIAFNAIPHIDVFADDGYTKEELKMTNETKKILDNDIYLTATCVRLPVLVSHSEAVNIEFKKPFK